MHLPSSLLCDFCDFCDFYFDFKPYLEIRTGLVSLWHHKIGCVSNSPPDTINHHDLAWMTMQVLCMYMYVNVV